MFPTLKAARHLAPLLPGAALLALFALPAVHAPATGAAAHPTPAGDPGPAPPGDAGGKKDAKKLRARAFLNFDKLPAGRTAEVAVVLDVRPGWHVQSNPPADRYGVPTVVTVKTTRGTKVGEFVYPTLPPKVPGGEPRPVPELAGRVVLRAPVEVPEAAAGGDETLEVSVKFQACNDTQCLRPKTLTFTGTLPVAGPSEAVAAANAEWFETDEASAELKTR